MVNVVVTVEDLPGVRAPYWPPGWPVPGRGDVVSLSGYAGPLMVRSVVWRPQGDDTDTRAHVAVVIGPPHPH